MRCTVLMLYLVLTSGITLQWYVDCGTDPEGMAVPGCSETERARGCAGTVLPVSYAMSWTDLCGVWCAPMCYVMCGTEMAYVVCDV
eukprot:1025990-Rhodomonas_salina.1